MSSSSVRATYNAEVRVETFSKRVKCQGSEANPNPRCHFFVPTFTFSRGEAGASTLSLVINPIFILRRSLLLSITIMEPSKARNNTTKSRGMFHHAHVSNLYSQTNTIYDSPDITRTPTLNVFLTRHNVLLCHIQL